MDVVLGFFRLGYIIAKLGNIAVSDLLAHKILGYNRKIAVKIGLKLLKICLPSLQIQGNFWNFIVDMFSIKRVLLIKIKVNILHAAAPNDDFAFIFLPGAYIMEDVVVRYVKPLYFIWVGRARPLQYSISRTLISIKFENEPVFIAFSGSNSSGESGVIR